MRFRAFRFFFVRVSDLFMCWLDQRSALHVITYSITLQPIDHALFVLFMIHSNFDFCFSFLLRCRNPLLCSHHYVHKQLYLAPLFDLYSHFCADYGHFNPFSYRVFIIFISTHFANLVALRPEPFVDFEPKNVCFYVFPPEEQRFISSTNSPFVSSNPSYSLSQSLFGRSFSSSDELPNLLILLWRSSLCKDAIFEKFRRSNARLFCFRHRPHFLIILNIG